MVKEGEKKRNDGHIYENFLQAMENEMKRWVRTLRTNDAKGEDDDRRNITEWWTTDEYDQSKKAKPKWEKWNKSEWQEEKTQTYTQRILMEM